MSTLSRFQCVKDGAYQDAMLLEQDFIYRFIYQLYNLLFTMWNTWYTCTQRTFVASKCSHVRSHVCTVLWYHPIVSGCSFFIINNLSDINSIWMDVIWWAHTISHHQLMLCNADYFNEHFHWRFLHTLNSYDQNIDTALYTVKII